MNATGNTEAPATLITGATGFIGRELLRRLLAVQPRLRLRALVRAPSEAVLRERTGHLLRGMAPEDAARIDVLHGDMTAPRFGLDDRAWDRLVEATDRALHCAASTRFDLSLEQARRENVDSTETVIALCRAARRRGASGRLDHVSTAFVAGRRTDVVAEDDPSPPPGFRNTYEQTKLEAEHHCRRASHDIPIAIHRPSIVVGRQSSGETTSYKAAYGPMRLLVNAYNTCPQLLNRVLPLPLPRAVRVDLVPVDYVAIAIAELFGRDDAEGRCFHLAAGPDGAATIEELVHLACDHFRTPRLRFLKPGRLLQAMGRIVARPLRRVVPRPMSIVSIMYAYGLGMPVFDTSNTRSAGLSAPPVLQYFELILRFASRSNFGRPGVAHTSPAGRRVPAFE